MHKYKEVELNAWYLVIGQNTGVGSLSLLQGIFPTQGSNPCLLHCGQILYQLSHKGSPRILEWVAYPFSLYLPDSVIELRSPALQEDSLPIELSGKPSSLSASVISQVFFGTTTLNSICSSFLCN